MKIEDSNKTDDMSFISIKYYEEENYGKKDLENLKYLAKFYLTGNYEFLKNILPEIKDLHNIILNDDPILFLASRDDFKSLKLFLESGVKLIDPCPDLNSIFYGACLSNKREVIDFVYKRGAKIKNPPEMKFDQDYDENLYEYLLIFWDTFSSY